MEFCELPAPEPKLRLKSNTKLPYSEGKNDAGMLLEKSKAVQLIILIKLDRQ